MTDRGAIFGINTPAGKKQEERYTGEQLRLTRINRGDSSTFFCETYMRKKVKAP